MGTGASKPTLGGFDDEGTSSTAVPLPVPNQPGAAGTEVSQGVLPPGTTDHLTVEKESGGGCPMKRSDGSYSFSLTSLGRGFQHPAVTGQTPPNAASTGSKGGDGACPVVAKPKQHQEYNVYSQPIDPSNQMPGTANQLPAPQQSKPLSTDRVVSTIPKVLRHQPLFLPCAIRSFCHTARVLMPCSEPRTCGQTPVCFLLSLACFFRLFANRVGPRKARHGPTLRRKCSITR
jgi:hypothetical protein